MSAQTRYGYATPIGAAGGIVDLAPYAVDTFLNEEENGVMKFGMGVVQGSKPGVNIALPESGATADKFEGVTTNNRTTEYDMDGHLGFARASASASCATVGSMSVLRPVMSLPMVTPCTSSSTVMRPAASPAPRTMAPPLL